MPEPVIPKGTGWDKNTERIEQDIEIGAVEIKDHDSDLRADVKTLVSGDNALVVETTPSSSSVQNVRIQDGDGTLLADVVTRADSNRALCVDVAGDIEIGAVELKDATTDTRAVVKSDGVDNALVVVQNSQPLPTGAATETTLSSVNANTQNLVKTAGTPTIQTVTLTNANTEYSLTLPANTKRFSMQPRTDVDVRFAFESGKVAGPVEPYATMKNGAPYTEWDLSAGGVTIYFASGTAGTVVELVSWS